MNKNIYVYADWTFPESKKNTRNEPKLIGTLNVSKVRNKEIYRFNYDPDWINSPSALQIDRELHLMSGDQYSGDKNFRIFLDSCPDRWGRLLMKRRESVLAKKEIRKPKVLTEADYLMGVYDDFRMGGLRFKYEKEGCFLDNNKSFSAPPMSSLKELEAAAYSVESNFDLTSDEYIKWLTMLISPGSSLGGARPKASIVDDDNSLWIAKFPSRHDDYDIAAWEYVTYQLALDAGIRMSECRIMKLNNQFYTFLTKRFDRLAEQRLHFCSAMTHLGYYDGDYEASYLELAEFISMNGAQTKKDLEQLWRRIVFNIGVSNTDDHLRNHGFILSSKGWLLSPAYDINPVTPSDGLHLAITEDDNSLDFDLAMEVIDYFQLKPNQAKVIMNEVWKSVSQWSKKAKRIGLNRSEIAKMESAFNYEHNTI